MLNRSASLAMSTSILKAFPGKLDIKRHSPSILYISASLAMSTSVLKALPGKLDIKRHSPSILYISASLAMSTSVLKALPGKLDIKRHSPSILYIYVHCTCISERFVKGCYAISVTGRLPPGKVRDLKRKGIPYRPRDVALKP